MKVDFTLYHFKHEGFGLLVYVEQSESESKLKITWTYGLTKENYLKIYPHNIAFSVIFHLFDFGCI